MRKHTKITSRIMKLLERCDTWRNDWQKGSQKYPASPENETLALELKPHFWKQTMLIHYVQCRTFVCIFDNPKRSAEHSLRFNQQKPNLHMRHTAISEPQARDSYTGRQGEVGCQLHMLPSSFSVPPSVFESAHLVPHHTLFSIYTSSS